jgi:hypothetical protein
MNGIDESFLSMAGEGGGHFFVPMHISYDISVFLNDEIDRFTETQRGTDD